MVVIPPRVALALLEQVSCTARGGTFTISVEDGEMLAPALALWCADAGHQVLEVSAVAATIRRGPVADPLAGIAPERRPGTRLWLYTNFDCNLACDYCCTRSSPQAARRALGHERITRLAREAADAGVVELLLTGGEPFLLSDIDALALACTDALPTTLLTNGTLFQGERLARLRRMDRRYLTLQISLDAATPAGHERHRGPRSWRRALAGIRIAIQEGFRVRVAATVADDDFDESGFRDFLDEVGIDAGDQLIRRLAHQGFSTAGLALAADTLVPEVTVTAEGVYWHPIGVSDQTQFVTTEIFPLAAALTMVSARFAEHRANAEAAAQWFPCA